MPSQSYADFQTAISTLKELGRNNPGVCDMDLLTMEARSVNAVTEMVDQYERDRNPNAAGLRLQLHIKRHAYGCMFDYIVERDRAAKRAAEEKAANARPGLTGSTNFRPAAETMAPANSAFGNELLSRLRRRDSTKSDAELLADEAERVAKLEQEVADCDARGELVGVKRASTAFARDALASARAVAASNPRRTMPAGPGGADNSAELTGLARTEAALKRRFAAENS